MNTNTSLKKWLQYFSFCLILLMPNSSPEPVTLAFLGDIMLGRAIAEYHSSGNWEIAFQTIAPSLQKVDFSAANLESPFGTQPDNFEGYNLCAPQQGVNALTAAGIDLLSLSNNHQNDCLPQDETTELLLQHAGFITLTSTEPLFQDIDGFRFAFLAYNDIDEPINIEAAGIDIREAKKLSDFVIVSIHWGMEFQGGADSRQEQIAEAFADAGASIIWGHHPHVLQPIEKIGDTIVLYSLGNALFDQYSPPDATLSAVILVTITPERFISFQAVPFKIDALHGITATATASEAEIILHRLGIGN